MNPNRQHMPVLYVLYIYELFTAIVVQVSLFSIFTPSEFIFGIADRLQIFELCFSNAQWLSLPFTFVKG